MFEGDRFNQKTGYNSRGCPFLKSFAKCKFHQMKNDPRSLCNCIKSLKKFRTSMGFEPVTSRYWCDSLTNWGMKPLMLVAGQLCSRNECDRCIWNKSYKNCGNESNKEWSSQLWTQFMQLRKKPEKNSGLLELCRALRNNNGLLKLHLEERGFFLIFFWFCKTVWSCKY